jgi:hypothetical protein
MSTILNSPKSSWLVVSSVLLLGAVVLLLAPEEQSLGTGIKSVYIHVALTWTAMLGLVIAGIVGVASSVLAKNTWQRLSQTVTWISLALFAAGLLMSMIAAGINWGGVFWQEPRTSAAIQVLVAGLVVQIANSFPINFRIKGLLSFFLLFFMFWTILSIPDVLHPGDAARTSPLAIRMTFYSLFALCTFLALWLTWRIHRSQLVQEVK